jgi:protein-L-isoaspartate(D-aspartate) O-methyltransferase
MKRDYKFSCSYGYQILLIGEFLAKRMKWLSVLIALALGACQPPVLPQQPTAILADGTGIQSTPITSVTPAMPTEDFMVERLELVANTIESRGVKDLDVLRAMRTVPRHEFVPEDLLAYAYEDHPLPIGYGQTISQPYVVAWMTELVELKPGEKVLEIGTGSGYQAAVLAELGFVEVYSIEIIPDLATRAEAALSRLGYKVMVKQGDGYFGWEEVAPFDAIIVTAAPDHLPSPLVAQLVEGGRLVIPIGPPGGYQSLWKFIKENGEVKAYNMGGVAFVPLTGSGIGQETPVPAP